MRSETIMYELVRVDSKEWGEFIVRQARKRAFTLCYPPLISFDGASIRIENIDTGLLDEKQYDRMRQEVIDATVAVREEMKVWEPIRELLETVYGLTPKKCRKEIL